MDFESVGLLFKHLTWSKKYVFSRKMSRKHSWGFKHKIITQLLERFVKKNAMHAFFGNT